MRQVASIAAAAAVFTTAAAFAATPPAMRHVVFPNKPIGKYYCVSSKELYAGPQQPAAGTINFDTSVLIVLHPTEAFLAKPSNWDLLPKDLDGLDFQDLDSEQSVMLGVIAKLPAIKVLSVNDTEADDSFIRKLPALPSLLSLSANNDRITGTAIKEFKKFPNLRQVLLANTLIKDSDCELLVAACPNLMELRMQRSIVGDKACAAIAKLSKLAALNMSRTGLTASGMRILYPLHKTLTNLDVFGDDLGDEGLAEIAKFEHMSSLTFSGWKKPTCTAKGIAALAGAKALQTLDMNNANIDDAVVRAIPAHLPRLKNLNILRSKNVTDAAFTADFAKLTELETLHASETAAGDNMLKAVSHSKHLRVLACGQNTGDAGLKALADAKSPVRFLIMDNSKVTDKGTPYLASLPALQTLSLSGTSITDAAVPVLSKLKALHGLAVENTGISKAGLDKLQAALPNCRLLR